MAISLALVVSLPVYSCSISTSSVSVPSGDAVASETSGSEDLLSEETRSFFLEERTRLSKGWGRGGKFWA